MVARSGRGRWQTAAWPVAGRCPPSPCRPEGLVPLSRRVRVVAYSGLDRAWATASLCARCVLAFCLCAENHAIAVRRMVVGGRAVRLAAGMSALRVGLFSTEKEGEDTGGTEGV